MKMSNVDQKTVRKNRWYFSGIAGAGTVCCTHPLDLIKTNLHMRLDPQVTMRSIILEFYNQRGVRGFYNGLSAAVFRQLTYSTARFALYDQIINRFKRPTFGKKLLIAGTAGLTCGIIGVPFDLLTVRLQSDVGLPPKQRRKYKNVMDGLSRIYREEGSKTLYSITSVAIIRTALLAIGQIAIYDETKVTLVITYNYTDDLKTHILSSFIASGITTLVTQPVDFLRTHYINAAKRELQNPLDLFRELVSTSPRLLLRGIAPSFARICGNTILTLYYLEQLRKHFGYIPEEKNEIWK